MSNLPTLIADLALILLCAGIMTLLFKKLKQPLVLGYGIAGFHDHYFLVLFFIGNGDRAACRLFDRDVTYRLGSYLKFHLIRALGLSILGGNDQGSGRSCRYGSRERSCRLYGN